MSDEEKVTGKVVDFAVLKRLSKFIKPYQWQFYLLVFLTVATALLTPVRPFIIQQTIDNEVAQGNYPGLVQMVILLVVLLVIQAFVQYAHTYLSDWLGQTIIRDLRVSLYNHILRLRLKFFDNTAIGKLVTRNVSDIETLSDVFSQGLAAMMSDLLQIVFILGIMFYMDWRLTLVSLSTLPLLFISTYIFKEKIKKAFAWVRNEVAALNAFVQEHITGMNIVQIFNSEQREYGKFAKINHSHRKAHLKTVKYYSIYFPVAEVIQAIGIGMLVWYGAKGVLKNEVSLGMLIDFIM